ncbi:hypothetical protein [Campylobacter sp. MG1]|uniref:hypothetical protein n=1 Tax=Campylobacter sp. MG1 TaxID=2976332 RepID=UPI00226D2C09|nr:hypothetical protein [Campylobacter sp. MG1]
MRTFLASTWKDPEIIYDDGRIVAVKAFYTNENLENAIGVYWKEVEGVATAYPVQGNAICPMRLNDKFSLILLKGLKAEADEKIVENIDLINDLITFYENKK